MTDRKRILIVDDEAAIGSLLAMCCEFWGLDAVIAHNGAEALRLLEERVPDLIVTDYMMPGMTGHEVCRRVRGDDDVRNIPIIMMSAAPEAARRECAADALLPKPLDLDEVERTIRRFLDVHAGGAV
jgi:CheY-like chemotaxis protein